MPTLHKVSTHLVVSGVAPTEYPDPTPNPEPQTATCYVELAALQPFAISIHVPSNVKIQGTALLFRIFKDGKRVTQVWRETKLDGDGDMDVQIEAPEALKFPHVVEDTNPNNAGDTKLWDEMEVLVQVIHARIVEQPSLDPFGNLTKGEAEPLPGAGHVLAFTFRYRPRAILREVLQPHLPLEALRPHPPERAPPRPTEPAPSPTSNKTAKIPSSSSTTHQPHPADVAARVTDTSKPITCTCQRLRPAMPMITCDNDDCLRKTYHLDCVDLTEETLPRNGEVWLCPLCLELPKEQLKIEGHTTELGAFQEEWIGKDLRRCI